MPRSAHVLTTVLIALAVVTGTGAFTALTADRAAAVDVVGDAESYLGMVPHSGPNGAYAHVNSAGLLRLSLTDANPNIGEGIAGGTGVGGDALTVIHRVFNVTNHGTQPVAVWITEDAEEIRFHTTTKGHGPIDTEALAVTLTPGETAEMGLRVDTRGETGTRQLLDVVTIHAVATGVEPPEDDTGGSDPPVPSTTTPAVLVGAPTYDPTTVRPEAGAVHVITDPVSGNVSLADDDATLLGEAGSDHAGWSVAVVGDTNGDGETDYLVGAPGPQSSTWNGTAYLVHGPVNGSVELAEANATFVKGVYADNVASTVAAAGDVDGDGLDDLLIGAPNDFEGGEKAGAAYLVYGGSLEGEVVLSDLGEAGVKFVGAAAGDTAGSSLAGAGDIDGDGLDDVVVGAPRNDSTGTNAGAVYVLDGESIAGRETIDLAEAGATLVGEPGERAGWSVSGGGDVDGDGSPDVLVGTPLHTDSGVRTGVAYLVSGADLSGTADLNETAIELVGEADLDNAGRSVAIVGDATGDGHADVLVGAPFAADGGRAYFLNGASITDDGTLADADAVFVGEPSSVRVGWSVAGAGDLDGDGRADVVIGDPANGEAGVTAGIAYLVYGDDLSGTVNLSAIGDSVDGARLIGENAYDTAGHSVDSGGDE